MRFGVVHRFMTNLLAALGILALITSGEFGVVRPIIISIALIGAMFIPEAWQQHMTLQRAATVGPLILLAVQVTRIALGASLLPTAVEFAIALQIVRIATRKGAAHDHQVILLAWLHLISGTVLGGGLAYGVCFIAFLIVAPGALVLSHLRREVEGNYRQGARDRTGLPVDVPRILRSRRVIGTKFIALTCLASVPIFLFTALIFVMFPRVGLSLLLLNQPTAGRMVGFSDHVDLGGVGTIRSDPTIVLRIEVPNLPDPPPPRASFYLRGTALDQYDGQAWSRSVVVRKMADRVGSTVAVTRYPSPALDPHLQLDLEPIDPPVIFLPAETVGLQVRARGEPLLGAKIEVLQGSEGELRYLSGDQRGITYKAFLGGELDKKTGLLEDHDRARYLQVPKLTPRLAELARAWTQGSNTDADKAAAILTRLQKDYAYSLDSPSGGASDPLDHFLFESHSGHCEFFSTAMAIMLRTQGVPTRNVTGLVGGTYNRFGNYYSVRQGDAHSWVEAHILGKGWVRYDPTPPAGTHALVNTTGVVASMRDFLEAMSKTWNRRVVRYDLQQQIGIFGGIRRGFLQAKRSATQAVRISTGESNGSFPAAAAIVGTALVVGGIWWWRKRRGLALPLVRNGWTQSDAQRQATALYMSLQKAMIRAHISRPMHVPPLAHALELKRLSHPMADAVENLTRRYLQARFGATPIASHEREHLIGLVRSVASYRPPED